MEEVRATVNSAYKWGRNRIELMDQLLDKDNFVAPDLNDVRIGWHDVRHKLT
jgi:hypothetical protein